MKLDIQRFAAPTVTFAPLNLATKVNFHEPTITITFSAAVRNIDDSAITNDNVAALLEFKKTNDSGAVVPFTATINEAKTIITVVPTGDLLPNQAYYLEVKANSFENDTNEAVATTNATWTTVTQPTITFAPLNAATNQTTAAPTITMTFQEAIRMIDNSAIEDADLVDMVVFKETNATGEDVACSLAINAGKTVITVTPTNDLIPNQVYYVGFLAGKVENGDGIVNVAQSASWTTSNVTTAAGTVVANNSIVTKAFVAGDLDGTILTFPASDEKTIIVAYNSSTDTAYDVKVKAPASNVRYSSSPIDLVKEIAAGYVGIIRVESAKYANDEGKINIDVEHADVKLAVFYQD